MIDLEEEAREEIREAGLDIEDGEDKAVRSRKWFITIWDLDDRDLIMSARAKYILVSDDDHTKEGQLHWHAVLQYKDSNQRLRTRNAHWIKCMNLFKAIEYCKKKGPNYFEKGNVELNTRNKEEWNGFIEKCKKASPKEMIDSEYSMMYARYLKFAGTVNVLYRRLDRLEELKNEWIWGRPGSGKTRYVWDNYESLYVKNMNKWWDGYNDEENVLIDDWDPEKGKLLVQYLKIWGDRYPFLGETKGSSSLIRPKRILITSNYSLEDCFQGVDYTAIKRRFKTIHMDTLNQRDEN